MVCLIIIIMTSAFLLERRGANQRDAIDISEVRRLLSAGPHNPVRQSRRSLDLELSLGSHLLQRAFRLLRYQNANVQLGSVQVVIVGGDKREQPDLLSGER